MIIFQYFIPLLKSYLLKSYLGEQEAREGGEWMCRDMESKLQKLNSFEQNIAPIRSRELKNLLDIELP